MILFFQILFLTFATNAEIANSDATQNPGVDPQVYVASMSPPPTVVDWCDGDAHILHFNSDKSVKFIVTDEEYSFSLTNGSLILGQDYSFQAKIRMIDRQNSLFASEQILRSMRWKNGGLQIQEEQTRLHTKLPGNTVKKPRVLKPCTNNSTS